MESKTIYFPNGGDTSTFTFVDSQWSAPTRISVEEYPDRIEMIYKQTSNLSLAVYPPRPSETRVFKIVFSCVDGKWHKSEPIFGKIIPSQEEYYEFND